MITNAHLFYHELFSFTSVLVTACHLDLCSTWCSETYRFLNNCYSSIRRFESKQAARLKMLYINHWMEFFSSCWDSSIVNLASSSSLNHQSIKKTWGFCQHIQMYSLWIITSSVSLLETVSALKHIFPTGTLKIGWTAKRTEARMTPLNRYVSLESGPVIEFYANSFRRNVFYQDHSSEI
jgi:hypothetical protein